MKQTDFVTIHINRKVALGFVVLLALLLAFKVGYKQGFMGAVEALQQMVSGMGARAPSGPDTSS